MKTRRFSFFYVKHTSYVEHKNMVVGNSMIGFLLVIDVSEWDIPGIEPGPLGGNTSALTNELQTLTIRMKDEL
jgi:hypothetical protein